MTDTNEVVLVGRTTRDIGDKDFGYFGQSAKLSISIAVNRSVKKEESWIDEVSYFNVVIWGKTAENLKPYLTKGKLVCITGYLKQDRWEKDGQKFSNVHIEASHVQLLGGKDKEEGSVDATFKPANKGVPAPVQQVAEAFGGEAFPENILF